MKDAEYKVKKVIAEMLNITDLDEISIDSNLKDDLFMDSRVL